MVCRLRKDGTCGRDRGREEREKEKEKERKKPPFLISYDIT